MATASVVTTTKVIKNKEKEENMTKQVQSTSIDENKIDNEIIENNTENIVKNNAENITENTTTKSKNEVKIDKNISTNKSKTSSKETERQPDSKENISPNNANNTTKTEIPEKLLPKGGKIEMKPIPVDIDEAKNQNTTNESKKLEKQQESQQTPIPTTENVEE